MKIQPIKYWKRLRSSFWFIPSTMVIAAVAMASIGVTLDEPMSGWLEEKAGWTFKNGADGASAVLGIIAGSMITIAGVVFSMTLVALSLASSQLGPRLLRNFMRDTRTQLVLGTFIATYIYCLLVLRTIRRAEGAEFVPNLSVSVGVGLSVASVGVLIYFIHHVSVSIQANEIAARIGKELISRVNLLFLNEIGEEQGRIPDSPSAKSLLEKFDQNAQAVAADENGYLQLVDGDALLKLATMENLIIRLECKPGNYVVAGTPLVLISPGGRVTKEITQEVQSLFVLGNQRTSDQDIEFAVNQLVEMAARALSTGINDPFTAIACVDHLGSALCQLATKEMPSSHRYDHLEKLRVIGRADTFAEIVDAAFNQIRQYARSNAAVTIRLLDTITVILGFVHRSEDRATLLRHAEMIVRGAQEGLTEKEDRLVVEERRQAVITRSGIGPINTARL